MFLSSRNYWMLSTPSSVTFQTCPNLWWNSFEHCLFSRPADLKSFKSYTGGDLSPTCCSLPTPRVTFYLLQSFSKLFVRLENTCEQPDVISIQSLKNLKYLWRGFSFVLFFLAGQKIPLRSILDLILNNLMATVQPWRFGKYCHCSQVHFDSEW